MAVQTLEKPASASGDLIRVPVSAIVPERVIGVPLYVADKTQACGHRLYRGSEFPITRKDLEKLADAGVSHLLIDSDDRKTFQGHLRDGLADTIADGDLKDKQRFSVLNQVVRDTLGDCFAAGDDDKTLIETKEMGRHTVDLISRQDVVATGLSDVLCHDYHTFTHSTNVAFYCVLLAQGLGISDHAELEAIAVAGFLHDLGKLDIADDILTKPGKLNDEEFATIQRHPTVGFRRLCNREDLSLGQLMMVYQHHERINGKGYPVGVAGEEIHYWARICAVADVFEALTSTRPYRKGMPWSEAYEIMDRGDGTHFDKDIYACWKSIQKSR